MLLLPCYRSTLRRSRSGRKTWRALGVRHLLAPVPPWTAHCCHHWTNSWHRTSKVLHVGIRINFHLLRFLMYSFTNSGANIVVTNFVSNAVHNVRFLCFSKSDNPLLFSVRKQVPVSLHVLAGLPPGREVPVSAPDGRMQVSHRCMLPLCACLT